ncbi:MAG: glutamate formimidoyltransferase [Methanobacteriota archaeon]|nr:MAG: glutamate formimidoyltransferase [Euryarchaeota archaeon]
MTGIVECVPNFSEGRRKEVVDAIADAARNVQGVRVLDVEMDPSHNRAVLTFVGEPDKVREAAFACASKAAEQIDLNNHTGEHPRVGATDVIPFIPISDVTMHDCVELAKSLGAEIAEKLGIPVYLYEEAATRPERKNLAKVREGQFEGLKEEIKTNPDRAPDFGPSELHPTAGATVVGAREPLIAYNINLGTGDVKIAKAIAKAVRFSSGGLKHVKALGFETDRENVVQVSMNLVNYKETSIFKVFEMVNSEAEKHGASVIGSEIVGLVPENALVDCAEQYLMLEDFEKSQILEYKLRE